MCVCLLVCFLPDLFHFQSFCSSQSESRALAASVMKSDGKVQSQDGQEEEGQAESVSVRRSLSNELRQAAATPERGQKRQSSSPGSSVTKFYRLDYMFGSSSEKIARQEVQPLSPAQQQALVSLESAEDSAAVVLPPSKRKGGRPKGSGRKHGKPAVGVRKHRAEPTAQTKLQLHAELVELCQQPGLSKTKARQIIGSKYGLSTTAVRNLEKTDTMAQMTEFVSQRQLGKQGLRRRGSHLSMEKRTSKAQGSRVAGAGKQLGRPDRCRVIWMATALWAQYEESQQHLLSLTDLVRDYEYRLQQSIQHREGEEQLSAEKLQELQAWRQKLKTLQTKKKQRDKEATKLAARAGLRERSCQQTQNISKEELRKRMEAAWRHYDSQLYKAAQPVVQEDLPVRDREAWFVNRKQTVLTFSDQIPVWLKPPPGKMLVSTVRQERALQQRVRKRARKKQAEQLKEEAAGEAAEQQMVAAEEELGEPEQPVETAARSPGQAPRWRVSFVARQAVEEYFQPDKKPVGRVMPSILLVYGSHCRLENISESGHWLETEQYEYQGQTVRREAGQKVSGVLMRQWRQLRQERPELFQGDEVLVWSQPSAVVDSVIYAFQQALEAKEHRQAVDLIDAFVGGWTEAGSEAAFITQRLRCCVGAGTTGLTQLTDIALAQPAKAALSRYHNDLRDMLREKARQEGVTPTYKTGLAEILEAARVMHQRMQQLNETSETVLRGARSGGWLHYRPDEAGDLQPVSAQPWAKDFPEGNSKMAPHMLSDRAKYVKSGKPVPFTGEEKGQQPQPEYEGSYLFSSQHGVQTGFFVDMPADFAMSQAEQLAVEELLQHPTVRQGDS